MQDYHGQATDVLDRARLALMGSDHPESAKVAQLRWELARLLREYQLFKHTEIFDPLIRGAQPRRGSAEALKARCLAVAADYDEHVRRWTLYGLVDAWPDYRREALALNVRMRKHLEQELQDVHQLLAGLTRVRQA